MKFLSDTLPAQHRLWDRLKSMDIDHTKADEDKHHGGANDGNRHISSVARFHFVWGDSIPATTKSRCPD